MVVDTHDQLVVEFGLFQALPHHLTSISLVSLTFCYNGIATQHQGIHQRHLSNQIVVAKFSVAKHGNYSAGLCASQYDVYRELSNKHCGKHR